MTALPLTALLTGIRADDHPVCMRDGRAVPLGRLRADVAALTHRLNQEAVRRIGLWCLDGYAFTIGLLAAAQAGCAIVLPPGNQPAVLTELSADWDRLVSDDPALSGTLPVWGGDPVRGGDPGSALAGFDSAQCPIDFFTSGSTAQAKRVPRTLGQLEREVAAVDSLWGGAVTGIHHTTVPHRHIYGLIFQVLWALAAGRPFAARSHELWETALAELADGDVLVSSPAHLSRLGGLEGARRPAMILSAGSPLSPAAAAEAERLFGVTPTEIYGSTETGAIATRPARDGSAWTPMPGNCVGCDDYGRLILNSPWVAGRHDGADLIAPTGNGHFHLMGRADRVVKIEGKRIGLAAVEAALTAQPVIADAAVVHLAGDRDELAAVVVLTPAGQALLDQLGPFRLGRRLRNLLTDHLEPLAKPRRWRFVSAIPTRVLGKRQDAAMAALFGEECLND